MNKYTTEEITTALDLAYRMFEEKKTTKEILALTGLNESQMWLDRTKRQITDGTIAGGFIKVAGETDTKVAAQIAKFRADGESWGLIAVRCQMPESRVRRTFTNATAIDSKGLRIGKGGRWVSDEPAFYTGGDRAKLGTELDPTLPAFVQLPTDDEAVRNLPKVAAALNATPKVRKPRAKKATAAKA